MWFFKNYCSVSNGKECHRIRPPHWHCTNNTYGCSPREPYGRFHWGDSAVSRSWLQRMNDVFLLGSHDVNATLYTDICSMIPKNNWVENYSTSLKQGKCVVFSVVTELYFYSRCVAFVNIILNTTCFILHFVWYCVHSWYIVGPSMSSCRVMNPIILT